MLLSVSNLFRISNFGFRIFPHHFSSHLLAKSACPIIHPFLLFYFPKPMTNRTQASQTPRPPNHSPLGFWSLEIVWDLEFGIWSFPATLLIRWPMPLALPADNDETSSPPAAARQPVGPLGPLTILNCRPCNPGAFAGGARWRRVPNQVINIIFQLRAAHF